MQTPPTHRLAAAASTLAIILALFIGRVHDDLPCVDGALLAHATAVILR